MMFVEATALQVRTVAIGVVTSLKHHQDRTVYEVNLQHLANHSFRLRMVGFSANNFLFTKILLRAIWPLVIIRCKPVCRKNFPRFESLHAVGDVRFVSLRAFCSARWLDTIDVPVF